MAAYMIIFCEVMDRPKFFENYAIPTSKLIAKYGGEYVLRAPGVEALEGNMFEGQSVVISKWPSKEVIHQFWNSDAYQALKTARKPISKATVTIVEE